MLPSNLNTGICEYLISPIGFIAAAFSRKSIPRAPEAGFKSSIILIGSVALTSAPFALEVLAKAPSSSATRIFLFFNTNP
jgi:hypothetical protein